MLILTDTPLLEFISDPQPPTYSCFEGACLHGLLVTGRGEVLSSPSWFPRLLSRVNQRSDMQTEPTMPIGGIYLVSAFLYLKMGVTLY